jgi:phosphoglycolate phosphatase
MPFPYSAVLFDLDGTILDSAPGITETLAYTFTTLGRPVPSDDVLLAFVGPPILDSFRDLAGMTPIEGLHALSIYRERYLIKGIYAATVYEGIPAILRAIHSNGMRLSLATSKPEYPATLMLKHFDLFQFFDIITGASEDESRSAKADVVAEALRRIRKLGGDTTRPVMIGDRGSDVRGAAENNVPAIFVEWGYGTAAEQVGSVAVAHTPVALRELLLGTAAE